MNWSQLLRLQRTNERVWMLFDRHVCSILDLIEEQYLNILAVYRFQNVAVKVVVNVFWFSFCCYADDEKVTFDDLS